MHENNFEKKRKKMSELKLQKSIEEFKKLDDLKKNLIGNFFLTK